VLAGSAGRTVQIAAADDFAAGLLPIVNAMRATGATTLEAIWRAFVINRDRVLSTTDLARLPIRRV
jgi:hypothetical protein